MWKIDHVIRCQMVSERLNGAREDRLGPDGPICPAGKATESSSLTKGRWRGKLPVGDLAIRSPARSFSAASRNAAISTACGRETDAARLPVVVFPDPDHELAEAVTWARSILELSSIVDQIETASTRVSDLVSAVKEYSYMDQAPRQEIDLHDGLETTLKMGQHLQPFFTTKPRVVARAPPFGAIASRWSILMAW